MANTKKTNKKGNKLNLKAIESASKKFTTKTVIIPVDDVEYEVKIQQVFRTTKIEKMVMDFLKSENVKEIEKLDESVRIAYFMFLIMKEFTDLDIPNNLKFNEQINLINSLIDLGIWEEIFKEIPEEEIAKVNEFMVKFNLNLNKVIEEMNEGKAVGIDNENVIVSEEETSDAGDGNGE